MTERERVIAALVQARAALRDAQIAAQRGDVQPRIERRIEESREYVAGILVALRTEPARGRP